MFITILEKHKSCVSYNQIFYFVGNSPSNTISFSQFNFDFNNYSNSTYGGHTSDVAAELAKLIAGANSYTDTEPSASISAENTGFTLTNDKKYYVSKPISVTSTGSVGNYTVSLTGQPSGTVVTDLNGNAKNTFAPNDKFLVKIPVASINNLSATVNVSINLSSVIYKAYKYLPPRALSLEPLQSVVVGESITSNLQKALSLKLDITTTVQISKVDATNSKEIVGAHLVIKDSSGTIVEEWDSDGTVHTVTGLLPGKYTLTETIAPEGYILSTETIQFEIFADGTVTKKTMKNYPKNDVYISKQDATTGNELPGAKLVLKNEKGKVVDEWVSKDTPHKVKVKLPAGKYTLTETIAPEGYELSTETVTFTVGEDGSVEEPVIMKNDKKLEQVPTGDTLIYIAWFIGTIAIGYSIYYFYNLGKEKELDI